MDNAAEDKYENAFAGKPTPDIAVKIQEDGRIMVACRIAGGSPAQKGGELDTCYRFLGNAAAVCVAYMRAYGIPPFDGPTADNAIELPKPMVEMLIGYSNPILAIHFAFARTRGVKSHEILSIACKAAGVAAAVSWSSEYFKHFLLSKASGGGAFRNN